MSTDKYLSLILHQIEAIVYLVFTIFMQEIQLSEVLSVDSTIDPLATDATRAPHCFEMKTRDMVYYVGQVEDENETPDPDSGIGAVAGQAWAGVTRSALMPGCVTPTTSVAPSSNSGEWILPHLVSSPCPTIHYFSYKFIV